MAASPAILHLANQEKKRTAQGNAAECKAENSTAGAEERDSRCPVPYPEQWA